MVEDEYPGAFAYTEKQAWRGLPLNIDTPAVICDRFF